MAVSEKTLENFLDAMNIIATHKATELQKGDQTVLCTIVDNSKAEKEGKYTVTDGSTRMIVFDNVNEVGKKVYKVDEQVYVTIPQNDHNRQKMIQGPYMIDNDLLPVTYVSPLDSFIDMATLKNSQDSVKGNIKSNGKDREKLLWSIDLRNNKEYDDLQKNNVYDTIGLQASFKCLLDSYRMRAGSYGLRMDLAIRLSPNSSKTVRKSLYLDSGDMFGNPYSFTLFSTQAQTYDISSLGIVDGIAISLYQNNDFTYYDGKNIVSVDPNTIEDNIFVKDIYVALGSEISKVTDNTLKLYTDDELKFSYENPSDVNNSKTLGVLWYNKTEENQYVGFSDGLVDVDNEGKIKPYDELEYLEKVEQEQRLLNQKSPEVPSDKNGLEVAANWSDATNLLTSIEKYLEGDLQSHLKSFQDRVNGVLVDGKGMDIYFRDTNNGKITKIINDLNQIKTWHGNLTEYFKKALPAAAALEKHQKEGTVPETSLQIKNENIYTSGLNTIFTNSIQKTLIQEGYVFNDLRLAISNTYPSFVSGYDIWSNKINSDVQNLLKMFNKLDELLNGLEGKITSTTENIKANSTYQYTYQTTIFDYTEQDFSNYDNRYCLYWYRYDSKAKDDTEGIVENGWVRIKPGNKIQTSQDQIEDNKFIMPNNLGLSTTYNLVDQVNKFDPKPAQGNGLLQVYLDREKRKEKFKVILFYNHEKFESNELEFENIDNILDLSEINTTDSIEIKNGTNAHDSYQTWYAASNSLSNQNEARVQRELTVHYKGLMGEDELLAGAQIYWYVPRNASMIGVDVNKLTDTGDKGLGFTTDYYRTARVKKGCSSYQGPSDSYKVVKSYSAGDTLTAVYDRSGTYYSLKDTNAKGVLGEWIHQDNIEIIDDKNIYRDGFACFYKTLGFDEVPLKDDEGNDLKDEDGNVITEKTVHEKDQKFWYQIKEYYTPTALNNTIFCVVKYGDSYTFETSKTLLFGQQGTTGTNYTISIVPAGAQSAVKKGDPLELLVKAYDYNNIEMSINSGSSATQTANPEIYGPEIKWLGPTSFNGAFVEGNNNVSLNDLTIGYKNDNSPTHYGILNFKAQLANSVHGGVIELTNYYPVPSSNVTDNYYIEGPTTIVYDSSGQNPVYYKDPYRIFDASTGTEISDCCWDIIYYLEDATSFQVEVSLEKDEDDNVKVIREAIGNTDSEEIDFYVNYVPILNNDNTITPSAIYISDENYTELPFYPVVRCYSCSDIKDANESNLIWAQPLVVYQNRYPNSMINNWDGSFKIDEDNGTILSQMVGAGLKNNDNTFSGILMGNVEGVSDDNKDGLGIFGFHHGAQSLNLNVDGTAFFGKSGRGRIYFDGNSGTISSASYQQNRDDMGKNNAPSDAGMMIDLDDGFIDMLGTSEFTEDSDAWENYPNKKGHTNYEEYKAEYGALYETDGTQSHIRLDVNSPYFQITSQNGNRLLHIGSDDKNFPLFTEGTYDDYVQTIKDFEDEDGGKGKGYYIKSDNYAPTLFSLDDKEPNENGAGMLIDLNSGRIDAYDLKLFSKNLFIDSGAEDTFFMLKDNDGCILLRAGENDLLIKSHSYTKWVSPSDDAEAAKNNEPGIKLAFGTSTIKPYVNIRGKESSIFYVGESSYYIQTDGYSDSGKTGAKINLTSGAFNLMGYADSSGDYAGSYVKLSSTAPYFRVHLKDSDSDLNLINIGNDSFYMNSPNWTKSGTNEDNYGGMQINMMTPKIEMWKLGQGKGIYIDASRSTWPIQIGDPYNDDKNLNLRIGWDGSLQGGKIGTNAEEWYIKADGSVSFKKGYIGGWTIGVSSLSGEGRIEGGTIDGSYIYGSTIDGGSLSIAGGKLTANSKGVSVSGNITCSSLNIATDAFTFKGKDVKLTSISYLSDVAKGIIPGYNGTKIVACEGVETTSATVTIDGTSYTFITSVKARGVSTYTFYDGKLNVIGYW